MGRASPLTGGGRALAFVHSDSLRLRRLRRLLRRWSSEPACLSASLPLSRSFRYAVSAAVSAAADRPAQPPTGREQAALWAVIHNRANEKKW